MSTDAKRMTTDVKEFNNRGWNRSSKQSDDTSQTAFMMEAQVKWTKVWLMKPETINDDDEL